MLPLLVHSLAFFGLAALPALAVIYWLRNRFQRYPVSSLMLWRDPRIVPQGGARIQRFRLPLLFFIELLVILLLVAAAAEPRVLRSDAARPLIVVLDDSFSMKAGGADSPRARALEAVERELHASGHASFRFLLAGEKPVVLGEAVHSAAEARAMLQGWSCESAGSAMPEALALASELGGPWSRLLVVSDQAPQKMNVEVPAEGHVQWWSFGRALPNIAFVNAARTAREGSERCLLEIANLWDNPQETTLLVEAGSPPSTIERSRLRLGPRETRKLILELKHGTPALEGRVGEDALNLDNAVTLLPAVQQPVEVGVEMNDELNGKLLRRGVRAIRDAQLTTSRPELLFTDSADVDAEPECWVVSMVMEKKAVCYSSPFILDRTHPLTPGLTLEGVLWGAGEEETLPGAPVILAGNVALLSDEQQSGGAHHVYLRMRPDLSDLQKTPGWPVLLDNLVHWRASRRPGLSQINLRPGEETTMTLGSAEKVVQVESPDGQRRSVPVEERQATLRGEKAGRYRAVAGKEAYDFMVNPLRQEESDLSSCTSDTWGSWLDETVERRDYQSVAWVFLVLALALGTLHLLLLARESGRKRR